MKRLTLRGMMVFEFVKANYGDSNYNNPMVGRASEDADAILSDPLNVEDVPDLITDGERRRLLDMSPFVGVRHPHITVPAPKPTGPQA